MNPLEIKIINDAKKMMEEAQRIIVRGQDRDLITKQVSEAIIASLLPVFDEVNKTTREAVDQYLQAIREIKVESPSVTIHPTEVKVPEILVPEAHVSVSIPKIEVPEIKVDTAGIESAIRKAVQGIKFEAPNVEVNPVVKMPDEMKVKGIAGYFKSISDGLKNLLRVSIEGVSRDNPLVVTLVDKKGQFYNAGGGAVVASGGKGASASLVSSVDDATKTVTIAGTRVQLSSVSVPCKRVFIQAHESNTGTMVVGGSNVVATLVGRRGFAIFPTQGDWFNVSNLSLLWLDSTVSGDKVNYYYEA